MKKIVFILISMVFVLNIYCQTIADIDKNDYKTITYGNQTWFAQNLNVSHFKNGDIIPEVKSNADWEKAYKEQKPAWCYYKNAPANGEKYGKLYNWYAVNDSRGLAPEGWHVPSDSEWKTLVSYLGGNSASVSKMKSSTGFNAKAAGHRYFEDCNFYHLGVVAFWWSSTKNDTYNAWYHALHFQYNEVGRDNGGMNTGFSVRCLKD